MDDYYKTPPQEIYEDIKKCSIEIRETYWYASEKIARVNSMDNISDNALTMVAMFDIHNQRKLLDKLQGPATLYVGHHLLQSYIW